MTSASTDSELPDFPFADTLGGGLYQVDQHYLGGGTDRVFFGRCLRRTGERYLISTSTDNGHKLDAVRGGLLRTAPGVFTPMFVGPFDLGGDDPFRDAQRRHEAGFVERLPDGAPLARALPDARPYAAALGAQIGRLLRRAVDHDVHVTALRPEYVWVHHDGAVPLVTGIGGRNAGFFSAASRGRDLPTVPLFTHKYVAPEVHRGEPGDDRALVLTLAVMVAEWATGAYPYPADGAWGYWNLCAGRHRELELPDTFAELLALGMRPTPDERPDLATFTDCLSAIAQA